MGISKKKQHTHKNWVIKKTCTKLFYLSGDDVDIAQSPDKLTKSSTKILSMHLYTLQIRDFGVC